MQTEDAGLFVCLELEDLIFYYNESIFKFWLLFFFLKNVWILSKSNKTHLWSRFVLWEANS